MEHLKNSWMYCGSYRTTVATPLTLEYYQFFVISVQPYTQLLSFIHAKAPSLCVTMDMFWKIFKWKWTCKVVVKHKKSRIKGKEKENTFLRCSHVKYVYYAYMYGFSSLWMLNITFFLQSSYSSFFFSLWNYSALWTF